MGKGTRLIHSNSLIDEFTGAVSTPIYQSVIFAQKDVNTPGQWEYTRSGNPTRAALEATIAELEGASFGFAFSSGMAAIATTLLLFSSGDHILVSRDVYGGTFRLVKRLLPRFGFAIDFIDTTDLTKIEAAIRPNTRAIYLETPSNPLMKITDLRSVVSLAQEHDIITITDNTFMTPYLQRPLENGFDIVIHSATKYLGGHSDCLAGLVVTKDPDLAKELAFLQNGLGAVLGPQDSWLILRGIKTLKVRLEQQQKTAELLASWLITRPEIIEVFYPGLPNFVGREIHFSQADGPGAMLSFRMKDDDKARHFINQLKLPVIGSSLGAVESIVSLPAIMSHAALTEEMRQKLKLSNDLVRLSVGLEDYEDLQADILQALESL